MTHPLSLGLLLSLLLGIASPRAATLTVNSTADDDDVAPGDGVCVTASGACSLRAAIREANALGGADTIAFDIPTTDPGFNATTGAFTISPAATLPFVSDRVTLDGYSQPGASPNTLASGNNAVLRIELDGSRAGESTVGLLLRAGGSVVRGLVVNRFALNGIRLTDVGGHVVEGNFIGTDVTGAAALGNGFRGPGCGAGVTVLSPGNTVGRTTPASRNLVSGNCLGIFMTGDATTDNLVQGNFIGTDATGRAPLGNATHGVAINIGSGNTVGGAASGSGNLISDNDQFGVWISGGATGTRVQGNRIGTDVTGTARLGNHTGVRIVVGDNNTIGGANPGAGNLISGNLLGVVMQDPGATGNAVLGNLIGTDASGERALGNQRDGVLIANNSRNTVGGLQRGARNRISFNGRGVVLVSGVQPTADNLLQRNVINSNIQSGVLLARNTAGNELRGNAILGNGPDILNQGNDNFGDLNVCETVVGWVDDSVAAAGGTEGCATRAAFVAMDSTPEAGPD